MLMLLTPHRDGGTTAQAAGVPAFQIAAPPRVAAPRQTVFVAMSGEGGSSSACSSCLSQLNLSTIPPTVQPAPQPEVTTLTGDPLVQADAPGDTVFLPPDNLPPPPIRTSPAPPPTHSLTDPPRPA